MLECPGCHNELPQVHLTLDEAHHLVRIWCPFCRVWWTVKCRAEEKVFGERMRRAIEETSVANIGA